MDLDGWKWAKKKKKKLLSKTSDLIKHFEYNKFHIFVY